ncbi:hypothetical protein V6Z11_D12G268900 [Gossypium hirsutum]
MTERKEALSDLSQSFNSKKKRKKKKKGEEGGIEATMEMGLKFVGFSSRISVGKLLFGLKQVYMYIVLQGNTKIYNGMWGGSDFSPGIHIYTIHLSKLLSYINLLGDDTIHMI